MLIWLPLLLKTRTEDLSPHILFSKKGQPQYEAPFLINAFYFGGTHFYTKKYSANPLDSGMLLPAYNPSNRSYYSDPQ